MLGAVAAPTGNRSDKIEDVANFPPQAVYQILAQWDGEAGVWVAESDDVPGLVAEASSPNGLIEKLRTLIPELLELNGGPKHQATNVHVLYRHEDNAVLTY